MKGKFITIEGVDGSGKGTQTRLLSEYLQSCGKSVIVTNEPGGTVIADKIRQLIIDTKNTGMHKTTELLLFLASRAEHTHNKIMTAINNGKIVLCDRYVDSTIAYQGYGHGMDIDTLYTLNSIASGMQSIDLTIWLDLPPQQGFFRKGGVDKSDRMENYNQAFYDRVYKGFCDLHLKHDRIKRVDASLDIDTIQTNIRAIVDKELL